MEFLRLKLGGFLLTNNELAQTFPAENARLKREGSAERERLRAESDITSLWL